MEGRDWVESLGGLEVAAAQQKDQLIARRAQARRDVLQRRGKVEAAFAFDAIENRREVEHLRRQTSFEAAVVCAGVSGRGDGGVGDLCDGPDPRRPQVRGHSSCSRPRRCRPGSTATSVIHLDAAALEHVDGITGLRARAMPLGLRRSLCK
jgi:hypothetical protein